MLNTVKIENVERKIPPSWLVEPDQDADEEEKKAYQEAFEKYETTGEGAEYISEILYSKDDSTDPDEIARIYGQLCVELKFLYVAITRPKNRLFIYDSTEDARKPIETIWKNIGIIEKVTE